jgi:uncharacterized protein
VILRRVGRTDVHLSAVGFGTCQLRFVPEAQALATLRRGFELGVNWVHVSPDYGGAEELVARAIRESGREVIPVSDGSGQMPHFEHLFERTCRIFDTERLDVWGISCIDDQEFVGHDVWGPNGMVESVLKKKREGRIGAVYCTTHGPPDYVADLITSGCFDAIMLAYNPLGFHVLSSYATSEGKFYEDMPANRERIFRLAREHGVGILVMKALAGGLLGHSRAFPPHGPCFTERGEITATDVLRHVLAEEGITAVVPGTACVEEAEENARAGHAPLELAPDRRRVLEERVATLRTRLCSRCGECEPSCSRGLPISWLFRDAYIWMNPADSFDALDRLLYFHLHPEVESLCAGCEDRSCHCPQGLDVPAELLRLHAKMLELRRRGLLPRTPVERPVVGDTLRARVVFAGLPECLVPDGDSLCRFWLENVGDGIWVRDDHAGKGVLVRARLGETVLAEGSLREDVHPGRRGFASFALAAPADTGPLRLTFTLESGEVRTVLEERELLVGEEVNP